MFSMTYLKMITVDSSKSEIVKIFISPKVLKITEIKNKVFSITYLKMIKMESIKLRRK